MYRSNKRATTLWQTSNRATKSSARLRAPRRFHRWSSRCFFFSSRRRHTRCGRDWSSDVCSSDLVDRDWYVFQNLELRNAGGRGLQLVGDHHVVRDLVIHGNHGDGILIKGSYNLIEDRSEERRVRERG